MPPLHSRLPALSTRGIYDAVSLLAFNLLLVDIVRLVGSDKGLKEVTVNEGKPIKRDKDGTFHVDGPLARTLVKSGDFAVAGTTFTGAKGYRCKCGFVGVFRDKCGRCGNTNLTPED